MTADEAKAVNAAIFDSLNDSELGKQATDAVNAFTRFGMFGLRHKWVPQLKRGLLRRIMPCHPIRPAAYWLALGVSAEELVPTIEFEGEALTHPIWETGMQLYEIVDNFLDDQDYEWRLLLRLGGKHEWRSKQRILRSSRRQDPGGLHRRHLAKAFSVFNHLTSLIASIAASGHNASSV